MFLSIALLLLAPVMAYEGTYAFRCIRDYESFEREWAFHHALEFLRVFSGASLFLQLLIKSVHHLTAGADVAMASAHLVALCACCFAIQLASHRYDAECDDDDDDDSEISEEISGPAMVRA